MTKRTAQTDIAVLGALSLGSMTGYAVREQIRDVLGHFWSESFGQIYPTLARLEREGAVRRTATDREGSARYEITPEGLDQLRARLREPASVSPPRNGLLLRLFFGRQLGVEACRDMLHQHRGELEARTQAYAAIRSQIGEDTSPDAPFWRMTLSAGEHHTRAAIAWADETLAALDEMAATTTKQRRRR